MKENRVCYVCCFYFGNRRTTTKKYDIDRSSYLVEQINSLGEFNHNLDRIIFVFNLEEEHLDFFEECRKKIPNRIRDTKVDVIVRENIGLSYGGWSEAFSLYRSQFDYYIFNEDDYFINDHNFDSYLVKKFNSYNNIGYLAGMVTNPFPEDPYKKTYAGNSFGISSYLVLNHLYEKFGFLPHDRSSKNNLEIRYESGEEKGQISQTYEIFKLGYSLFDVREDYCTPHDMGRSREEIECDHVVERFFWWNDKALIIPASIKFDENFYIINIIDPQYQKKRSCYIINFYFGPRRRTIDEYKKDPLCFLKKHIEVLSSVPHNLDKIIFNFNVDPCPYSYLNSALKLIPKNINNSEVEIYIRENFGISYGAFSDNFGRNKDNFDYFIFNEDDYFPIEKNWDEYLIRKFNSLPSAGYLCMMRREEDDWNNYKTHAGYCFGVFSASALNEVWKKNGCIPHSKKDNLYETQESAQIDFTHSVCEVGFRIYDVREEYRFSFARTEKDSEDIWRWFWWNERDLILPAILIFGERDYTWYECFDGPCIIKNNL